MVNFASFKNGIICDNGKFFGVVGKGAWVKPDNLATVYAGPVTLDACVKDGKVDWYEKFLKSGRRIFLPKTKEGVKLIWREYKTRNETLTLKY